MEREKRVRLETWVTPELMKRVRDQARDEKITIAEFVARILERSKP